MFIKKIKAFWKFVLEYKHYFIASACVFILAFVLIYPYYCQNVKFRFIDKTTGTPIANVKFYVFDDPFKSIYTQSFIKTMKTDSQGYAYLDMVYIKAENLAIRNEDYFAEIERNSSKEDEFSKWYVRTVSRIRDSCIGGVFIKVTGSYNLLTGWFTFIDMNGKKQIKKYSYIELLCRNTRKEREAVIIRMKDEMDIIDDVFRNVHTLEEFKKFMKKRKEDLRVKENLRRRNYHNHGCIR